MESAMGQVSETKKEKKPKLAEKLLQLVKKTREEHLSEKERRQFLSSVISAKSEFDLLSKNLNFITDADTKEYCIYRLKAAELNLNRHIKRAKAAHITQSPFTEEII